MWNIAPGKLTYITMANHNCEWENPLFMGNFQSLFLSLSEGHRIEQNGPPVLSLRRDLWDEMPDRMLYRRAI